VKFQEDFATNHRQINSFIFAPTFDFGDEEQIVYPLLLSDVESSTIQTGGDNSFYLDTYVFRVLVTDQLKPDLRNEVEVLSDCKLMLNDFIAYFRQTRFNEFLEIDTDISMNVVKGSTDDVIGWECNITFKIGLDLDLCGIPMSGTPSYVNPLLVTIYDQNNNVVTQLSPGQQYSVVVASGVDEGNSTTTYTIQVIDI